MLHTGRHFLQIPGPTNVPDRVLRAMDQPVIDHRGPEFAAPDCRGPGRTSRGVQDERPGHHFSGVRHRRRRSRAREHVVARRSGPDFRNRPFLPGVAADRRTARPAGRLRARQLAPGRIGGRARDARLRADPGRTIKAVVVVHNETSTGVTSRLAELRRAMNRGRPSGAADRRRRVVARLDRLPPGRVGGRRHGRRLAEGADASAGPRLQRRVGEGAGGQPERRGLSRSYWDWQEMLKPNRIGVLPVHASNQPALRAARGAAHAGRRRARRRLRPPRSSRRGGARGRARLGIRARLRGPARILELDYGLLHARRITMPIASAPSCSNISTCRSAAGCRGSPAESCASVIWALQRSDARRHAERDRNGPPAGGRPAPGGRCDGGTGLSGAGRRRCKQLIPLPLSSHAKPVDSFPQAASSSWS